MRLWKTHQAAAALPSIAALGPLVSGALLEQIA